jgi:hypothetical protein
LGPVRFSCVHVYLTPLSLRPFQWLCKRRGLDVGKSHAYGMGSILSCIFPCSFIARKECVDYYIASPEY